MHNRDNSGTILRTLAGTAVFGVLALAPDGPANAVDGVIEINQARATAGGVTTGDTAGFPVSLNTSGSYRLTSDLTIPAGLVGITVGVDDVTIDLNGFSIVGGGGASADGISLPDRTNVEVRNGTIRGFSRNGIFTNVSSAQIRLLGLRLHGNTGTGAQLSTAGLVDGCTVEGNGNTGILAGIGTMVINSIIRSNTLFGLNLPGNAGYRSNVLTGNNGGDANAQVLGGVQLGTNVCGTDTVCP